MLQNEPKWYLQLSALSVSVVIYCIEGQSRAESPFLDFEFPASTSFPLRQNWQLDVLGCGNDQIRKITYLPRPPDDPAPGGRRSLSSEYQNGPLAF